MTLLYAAGAALLGSGAWLQRKREKESLRNYGQVLFAGGLAAVYFTTYAAHYVEVLRVIASPLLDGVSAARLGGLHGLDCGPQKSEVLALFAVGLAYYTSAITDVGLFTLDSNLVLTEAAVFFLVRNRWTTLSFISVVATYGGFAFWRFHRWRLELERALDGSVGRQLFPRRATGSCSRPPCFSSRGEKLRHANRGLYAGLNNGAFFVLVLLSMIHAIAREFLEVLARLRHGLA